MQTNTPYNPTVDQMARNPISMSQPVLTRSLPSISASNPMSQENVIVSGIYQSYIPTQPNTMGIQSRTTISGIGGIGDGNVSQKHAQIQSSFQNPQSFQKYSPPLMSTARPITTQQQPNYSTVIPSAKCRRQHRNATTHMLNVTNILQCTYPPINDNVRVPLPPNKTRSGSVSTIGVPIYYNNIKRGRSFSQILDKSKKKSKSKMKTKYLLKIIKMEESINPGETILSFEMMSPKSQMRFTCCLNKEINNLEALNSVGEYNQEFGKKDIIESLVNTVKKMCQQLKEDINSISLNEDYVFHPCLPNTGLMKLSDYLILDHEISGQMTLNQCLQPGNFTGSCASSRSLSRHPSNEDLPGMAPLSMVESLQSGVLEYESLKCGQMNLDAQKRQMKSTIDNESIAHTIVSTKCSCPINDSVLKVPEYIFPYVKQIVDKLLNHSCKGLIILPQSNDILTRSIRILDIPPDHIFIGLPCADSSFNVTKAPKDEDFIIAKNNRDQDNVTGKCVYQKPTDGVVLLDSSGEIQRILNPTLVIPPKPGFENQKTTVKELPSELTHNKDQSLDCDQIVSVLQSLTHIQHSTDPTKDELFDSPVLLEPVKTVIPKSQNSTIEKVEVVPETVIPPRRGSDESTVSQSQMPSQIQVERIYCEYVALHKASDGRHDDSLSTIDHYERDLPKQQVRSRKISNESLDSIAAIRTRATSTVTCVNEADLILSQHKPMTNHPMKSLSTSATPFGNESDIVQSQPCLQKVSTNPQIGFQNVQKSLSTSTVPYTNETDLVQAQTGLQKMMANNQMNLQNAQFPIGTIINQMPIAQRIAPNPALGPAPGQFVHSNPFIQNAPLYTNTTQVPGASVVMSQSNTNIPVPLGSQTPTGMSFSHIQMSQMHQMQQNPTQRFVTPAGSSQMMTNIPNIIPTVTQIIQNPVYPVQKPLCSEQHVHPGDIQEAPFSGLTRQMPIANMRQIPQTGASQYFEQNMINALMAENQRIHAKNQPPINAQAQPPSQQAPPVLIIPNPAMPAPMAPCNTTPIIPHIPLKVIATDPLAPPQVEIYHATALPSEPENKTKIEQIGRFVVRPTDSTEKS